MRNPQIAEAVITSTFSGVSNGIFAVMMPRDCIVIEVRIHSDTAPGGNTIFDVNKNGVTIFNAPSDRPTITSGQHNADVGDAFGHNGLNLGGGGAAGTFSAGDILTVDLDAVVGSIGGNLYIAITTEEVSQPLTRCWGVTLDPLVPSASANTYGTTQFIDPTPASDVPGQIGFAPLWITITQDTGGGGWAAGEKVTVRISASLPFGGTQDYNYDVYKFTDILSVPLTDLYSGGISEDYIPQLSVQIKSSIGSSTAQIRLDFLGLSL